MERTNNYLIRRDEAKKYFLNFDQEALIRRWGLEADSQTIHVRFLGRPYRICRVDGDVLLAENGTQAGFEEVLSIFDLLCHAQKKPSARPAFAQINSLEGRPPTAGVSTQGMYGRYAGLFGSSPDRFRRACARCGGTAVAIGDIGYEFPVFEDLRLRLRFYEADDEFPPQLSVLFNSNALEYAQYETVFYIAGFLLGRIAGALDTD